MILFEKKLSKYLDKNKRYTVRIVILKFNLNVHTFKPDFPKFIFIIVQLETYKNQLSNVKLLETKELEIILLYFRYKKQSYNYYS